MMKINKLVLLMVSLWVWLPNLMQASNESAVVPLAVQVELKPRLEGYLKARNRQVNALALKYGKVIDSRLNKSADAGDLKTAEAFQAEKKRLQDLQKSLQVLPADLMSAAKNAVNLPGLPTGEPAALLALRKIWDAEWQKIESKLGGELQTSLKMLETKLTKARELKNAKQVLLYRESLVSAQAITGAAATVSKSKEGGKASMAVGSSPSAGASKEKPFTNSLGMRFVPVPITGGPTDGQRVLFSIWETRVKDYERFIRKNRHIQWQKPSFKQKGTHAAGYVSWEEAVTFCEWLTEKEHESGELAGNEVYRLPTDHEWSCAVGIGTMEDAAASPFSKARKIRGEFPWGKGYPPPEGAGNYNGEEAAGVPSVPLDPIAGYDDGFVHISPVGSFKANDLGLYDLGGNVWEMCQDQFNPNVAGMRVHRGSAYNWASKEALLSSARGPGAQDAQVVLIGFRVVLAPAG